MFDRFWCRDDYHSRVTCSSLVGSGVADLRGTGKNMNRTVSVCIEAGPVKKTFKAAAADDSNVCIGADRGWEQVINLMMHARVVARGVCDEAKKKTYS